MTAATGAPTWPICLAADPRRLAFRLALGVLGLAVLGSAALLVLRAVTGPAHWLGNSAQAASRILPISAAIFATIRWVYVARTRLVLDGAGLCLHQPLATRRAAWCEIADVQVVGPMMPTHRGGIPIAIRVTLSTGRTIAIPDVFTLRRDALAACVATALRSSRAVS